MNLIKSLSLLNGFTHVVLNPLQNKHSRLYGNACSAPQRHSQLHWENFLKTDRLERELLLT